MSERFDLIVRGGTVVTRSGRAPLEVCVRDGRVAALHAHGRGAEAVQALDAGGLLVLPGMVDTHVHFMDPGDTTREDFPTGSAAAAISGVTSVIEHTHAWPVTSTARLEEKLEHLRGRSWVDFGLAAHVFPDSIDAVPDLWRAGIAFFKVFTCATHGVPAITAELLLDLAGVLAIAGAPCLVHCEDDAITAAGERRLRDAGRIDGAIVPEWRSREAEAVAVATLATVAELSGARFVVAHASSPDVLDRVARARSAGARILAETCPQYLLLREREVLDHGALRKFTPPARLRSDADEQRMWAALNRGLVHHLASDHAPSTRSQKERRDIWEAPFGLPGIDTTLALCLDAALTGRVSLERIVEAYATAPSRLYGLEGKGEIAPGFDADLVLVDPDTEWVIDDSRIVSKAGWSPYSGRRVRGRAVATVLRGEVIARDGELCVERPVGRFLAGGAGRRI